MNLRNPLAMLLVLIPALFAPAHAVRAADLDTPMVLVATPALDKGAYRQSVLLALPDGNGVHFGFLLNRLTNVSLAQLLPEQRELPNKEERVYVGGPFLADRMFALVSGQREAGPGVLPITPDLFLATEATELDRLLADGNRHAHFYVGMVVWRPGELEGELEAGAWQVLEPATEIVLSTDPDQQWSQLSTEAYMLRAVESHSVVPRLLGRL